MPNMVILNDGKEQFIKYIFNDEEAITEDFSVALYTNNYTPIDTSVIADFTLAEFDGYVEAVVTRAEFSGTAIVANVAVITASEPPSYSSTDPVGETVYGWVMFGADSGTAYVAQLLSTPRLMNAGASILLSPFAIQLKSI